MQDIFSAFPEILRHIDAEGLAVEPVVFAAWHRCVNGVLAEHASPVRLDGNRLIVAVTSETWRRNVADLGPALTARMNSTVGANVVKFVEFTVDPAAFAKDDDETSGRTDRSNGPDRSSRRDPGLEQAAAAIKDDSLRESFLAAAGQNLARRERTE